tara:strand:+ start:816 stop:1484 length:669 start_codon:yes stop_codon:yes gene_type:complete
MFKKYVMNEMPVQINKDLVYKYKDVETATIGHIRQIGFACPKIKPLIKNKTILGTAVTLAIPGQDSTLLHHIVGMLRKGDILVIDRLGDHKHACIGGGVMCAIKASGCSGVIVDGTITDINELLEYDIPIWSRGLSPITTRLYNIGGALNTPVSIGGAAVLPGYCVIADDSGVLFLPSDEVQNYAQWAKDYQEEEPASHEQILNKKVKLGEITGASKLVEEK